MATTASYASTPGTASVRISTANTARDGTGTLGTLKTAGANGSRVDQLSICAISTTTAGMLRFFMSDGTNIRLLKEVPVAATTPSGTVQAFTSSLTNLGWIMKTGWSLLVGTNNAESFDVICFDAGDF